MGNQVTVEASLVDFPCEERKTMLHGFCCLLHVCGRVRVHDIPLQYNPLIAMYNFSLNPSAGEGCLDGPIRAKQGQACRKSDWPAEHEFCHLVEREKGDRNHTKNRKKTVHSGTKFRQTSCFQGLRGLTLGAPGPTKRTGIRGHGYQRSVNHVFESRGQPTEPSPST